MLGENSEPMSHTLSVLLIAGADAEYLPALSAKSGD
jgi:hypothetical protein